MSLTEKVQDYIQAHAKFDTKRDYLGMSSIGRCPNQLFSNFFNPQTPTGDVYRSCYLGYLWEREAKAILKAIGIYKPDSERELIAPFDSRFVGHTDGETVKGNLLEIKSVTAYAMEKLKRENRLKPEHFAQVQTYMRYGGYPNTLVALVSRDPLEFHFLQVPQIPTAGERLEQKAKSILAAIDARQRPACECNRCR